MSKNTVSLEMHPHGSTSSIHSWSPPDISLIRKKLLKLALEETGSREFLQQSLALVSAALATAVFFVDDGDDGKHGQMASFLVSAQNKSIGCLLLDSKALQQLELSHGDVQELADIIGISLLSLQQGEELEMLETESEEMLHYAPDVIFVLGTDGAIRMANQKAGEFANCSPGELKGQHISSLITSLTVNELFRRGTSGDRFEVEMVGVQGRRLASFNISIVAQENADTQFLMVGRDITTERQAELALRRSERSTLMSQTIDYLIHEVNNPLAALMSSISTVLRKTEKLHKKIHLESKTSSTDFTETDLFFEPEQIREDTRQFLLQQQKMLESAKRSGTRINDAMKMLRAANHKRTLSDGKPVDPLFEMGMAITGVEHEHPGLKVQKKMDQLPMLEVPPLHLAEIFGAVLKNAAEAVAFIPVVEQRILVTGQVENGQVILFIQDNGSGVPVENRDRVFMPFYTTKPLGNAIGLGLSMAKDMVKRVGGTIEMGESCELGGTSVCITLPVAPIK